MIDGLIGSDEPKSGIWSLSPGDNTISITHPGEILWGANGETGRVWSVFLVCR